MEKYDPYTHLNVQPPKKRGRPRKKEQFANLEEEYQEIEKEELEEEIEKLPEQKDFDSEVENFNLETTEEENFYEFEEKIEQSEINNKESGERIEKMATATAQTNQEKTKRGYRLYDLVSLGYTIEELDNFFGPKEIKEWYNIPTGFTRRYGQKIFGQPIQFLSKNPIWDKRNIPNISEKYKQILESWQSNLSKSRRKKRSALEVMRDLLKNLMKRLNLYDKFSEEAENKLREWQKRYGKCFNDLLKIFEDEINEAKNR